MRRQRQTVASLRHSWKSVTIKKNNGSNGDTKMKIKTRNSVTASLPLKGAY